MEGLILRQNIRGSDVFFNSNFECGNLRQAFIVPQESDYEANFLEDEMDVPQTPQDNSSG